ncbi:hypothetical protein BJ742DRAFT_772400 [Cladochytrium replicatum]|nr:hypothetical protein BJ742DRAFT_772400 [Cladochytrium replicatum]
MQLPPELASATTPLRVTLISFGTRGDVQPFVALGKALIARGHSVRLATNTRFQRWVESHGLAFRSVGNDEMVLEVMAAFSQYGFISPQVGALMAEKRMEDFYMSVWSRALAAVDEGTDFLLSNVFSICGQHIAQGRNLPHFEVMPMIMFRTSSVPAVIGQSSLALRGEAEPGWLLRKVNKFTHEVFASIWSVRFLGLINRFRSQMLGTYTLGPIELFNFFSLEKGYKGITTFTPRVLDDIPPQVYGVGSWFLHDAEGSYTPPPAVQALLADPAKRVIYIGFGSIRTKKPVQTVRDIIKVVKDANVCAIVAIGGLVLDAPDIKAVPTAVTDSSSPQRTDSMSLPGAGSSNELASLKNNDVGGAACCTPFNPFAWCIPSMKGEPDEEAPLIDNDRYAATAEEQIARITSTCEREMQGQIAFVNSIPHDWVFPKVSLVVHHGGTGTVMEAFKAGKPQVVKPFFGDQYVWGSLVERNRVGKMVTPSVERIADGQLSKAIVEVMRQPQYAETAEKLGREIAREDGVGATVALIEKEAARIAAEGGLQSQQGRRD